MRQKTMLDPNGNKHAIAKIQNAKTNQRVIPITLRRTLALTLISMGITATIWTKSLTTTPTSSLTRTWTMAAICTQMLTTTFKTALMSMEAQTSRTTLRAAQIF